MPKISVVVPVYGGEKYLGACIESILGQTFKDFPDFSVASPKISYMSNKGLICPCSSVRNKVLLMILPLGSFT